MVDWKNSPDHSTPLNAETIQEAFDEKLDAAVASATYAAGVSLPASNGTDDTVALNAAALAGAGKVLRGAPGQFYRVSTPVVLRSGTTLDMTGCTVTLIDNSNANMVQNYAANNPQRTTTTTTTAGSTTVTGTGFNSGDVGRSIVIQGAQGNAYCGVIQTYVSSTSVTVGKAPTVAVTGAVTTIYDRDHDITVRGGTWVRGLTNDILEGPLHEHMLIFRHIDRLTVGDFYIQETQVGTGKYMVNPSDVTDFTIANITVNAQSAHGNGPISVGGPAIRGVISNISGFAHDDMVALLGSDSSRLEDFVGDIADVLVDGVHCGIGTWGGASTASRCGVKIVGGDSTKLRRITVRNVTGAYFEPAVRVWDDPVFVSPTDIANLLIEDINAAVGDNQGLVELTASNIKDITVRNLTQDGTGITYCYGVRIRDSYLGSSIINSLVIDGVVFNGSPTNPTALYMQGTTLIYQLSIRGYRVQNPSGTGGCVINLASATGHINRANVTDFIVDRIGNLVDVSIAGGLIDELTVGNGFGLGTGNLVRISATTSPCRILVANVNWQGSILVSTSAPADIFLSNIRFTGTTVGVRALGSTATPVRIFGHSMAIPTSTPGATRDGSQVVNVRHPDIRCDLSILAKVDGDEAFNTNAGLACGVGRAVSNGTNWKNLYTGSTY